MPQDADAEVDELQTRLILLERILKPNSGDAKSSYYWSALRNNFRPFKRTGKTSIKKIDSAMYADCKRILCE
jgi:hypothetical protein